jgi:hypothetical protein
MPEVFHIISLDAGERQPFHMGANLPYLETGARERGGDGAFREQMLVLDGGEWRPQPPRY